MIPSCAIWAIPNKFPPQDNKYVNFVESDIDMKLKLATSWKENKTKQKNKFSPF